MSFALVGQMLANRVGIAPKHVIDGPLSAIPGSLQKARAGGVIDLSSAEASFITAEAADALIGRPPVLRATVIAQGRILDGEFAIHRFYLGSQTGEAPTSFLQVITQRDQIVAGEIKLFRKLAEITPSSPEEWDLWLVGSDDQPPLLTGPSIRWQGTFEFNRAWSPGPQPVDAKQYVETIHSGEGDHQVAESAMLFSRALTPNFPEWLQLALCQSGAERWIEAYVGISLDAGEVTSI
ncbi:hypothetical protein ACVIGB_000639 [Bradyrhizobium sp. USDA 4341]